ncbi:MAG: helix-turn-helix domain-containing protein [Actinomycetota bacterium]|nr:helix-turn-helix domain-containing protein [Actinomycetota bacterium]
MEFSTELRERREMAGLTQAQLAALADTSQSRLSSYESGTAVPNPRTRARLLAAARPLPGDALDQHREDIKRLADNCGLDNVRVFGSIARNEDVYVSDIDLLVTPREGASLYDLTEFAMLVEKVTGYRVDVVSDRGRAPSDVIVAEALAL